MALKTERRPASLVSKDKGSCETGSSVLDDRTSFFTILGGGVVSGDSGAGRHVQDSGLIPVNLL